MGEPEEWWPDAHDDGLDDDVEVDVCSHCGGHFAWTDALREAWQKHWNPSPTDRQPQRCMRCIADDAWIDHRPTR